MHCIFVASFFDGTSRVFVKTDIQIKFSYFQIHLVGDLDGAVTLQAGITSQCPSDVSPMYHSRLKT